jgi:hypothetical protein
MQAQAGTGRARPACGRRGRAAFSFPASHTASWLCQQRARRAQGPAAEAVVRAAASDAPTTSASTAPGDRRAGRMTYKPLSYGEMVTDAVESVATAIGDGLRLLEVEFPALPTKVDGARVGRTPICKSRYAVEGALHACWRATRGARSVVTTPDCLPPLVRRAAYKGSSDLFIDSNTQLALAAAKRVRRTRTSLHHASRALRKDGKLTRNLPPCSSRLVGARCTSCCPMAGSTRVHAACGSPHRRFRLQVAVRESPVCSVHRT